MPLDLSSIMGLQTTSYHILSALWILAERDGEDIVIKISRKADSFV